MQREQIKPEVAEALAVFLEGQGLPRASADGLLEALSRDLAAGQAAAERIYDGLVRRAIDSSRDAIVSLCGEMADLPASMIPAEA
jgi:hypothetical protein